MSSTLMQYEALPEQQVDDPPYNSYTYCVHPYISGCTQDVGGSVGEAHCDPAPALLSN